MKTKLVILCLFILPLVTWSGNIISPFCLYELDEEGLPKPKTWELATIVMTARQFNSRNHKGVLFNHYGFTHSLEELQSISSFDLIQRPIEEIAEYSDIVVTAFPDHCYQKDRGREPKNIENLDVISLGNLAYVALFARKEINRNEAKNIIQSLKNKSNSVERCRNRIKWHFEQF